MRFMQAFVGCLLVLGFGQATAPAVAQTFPSQKTTQNELISGGLQASMAIVDVSKRNVRVQFTIENKLRQRQYLAVMRNKLEASLSNGHFLYPNDIAGASMCFGAITDPAECFRDAKSDLYIESGDSAIITIRYDAGDDIPQGLSIIAPLKLSVRTALPDPGNGNYVEREPGPAHLVRFNFPPRPLP